QDTLLPLCPALRPPCTPLSGTNSTCSHPTPLPFLEVVLSEPGPGVPQSLIVGDVDGTPCERCGSERGRMEAQTPGMGAGAEGAGNPEGSWWSR
uniref:Uncharacterized protein n=1 Tax=Taeniopygia guttata TaxID=59729 RepID=A0A674G9Q5_TAEGU